MTKYICKCGRVVAKSTNADNTGNRDTAGCEGCPYLLPWGPTQWDATRHAFVTDVKGYECRMSKDLEYATRFGGSITDKCTCYIASLDFDFLSRVSDWIKKTYPDGELSGGFSTSCIRAAEYCSNGRYRMSISCAQNKKGITAKATLLHQFFDDSGARLDMTPDQEKAHILAAIEAGKARAQKKEERDVIYKDPATGWLYRVSPPKVSSAVWKPWPVEAKTKATSSETIAEVLEARAKQNGWEPVEEVPIENPTPATEDVQQCAPTVSDVPPSPDQSASTYVENAGMEDADAVPDVCPYLQPLENSTKKKYAFQCSICGDKFVNQEICNKTFLGCGWYMDQQEKAGQTDDDESNRFSCMCRTCGKESCFAHGCAKECPANADESCLTESCPEYVERMETVCGGEVTCAPSGAAAVTTGGSAAAEYGAPGGETKTMAAGASGVQPPRPLAQPAPRQTEPATATAPVAPSSPAFDYSGLDSGTAERLQNLARRAMEAKQRYVLDLMEIVVEAHRELVQQLDKRSNQYSDTTFVSWCASIGVGRSTAYNLLHVQSLMDGSTPEEQEVLAEAPANLLYAAAKPSAPAEAVQAVKNGDITTHKQYQELLAEVRARDAKIEELLDMSEAADRRADEARARAQKAEQEAALDRKEREDAHEKAMHYKAECDRRAQEQQRVEGLLSTREEQLRQAQQAAQDAARTIQRKQEAIEELDEIASDRLKQIEALEKGRTIEAQVSDPEEVRRQAEALARELAASETAGLQEENRLLRSCAPAVRQAWRVVTAAMDVILEEAEKAEAEDESGLGALEDCRERLLAWWSRVSDITNRLSYGEEYGHDEN